MMLTFHTNSNKTLGRQPLSMLKESNNNYWNCVACFPKNILRDRYYKFQPTGVLAVQSMDAKCFVIGKRLITLMLSERYLFFFYYHMHDEVNLKISGNTHYILFPLI